MPELGAHRQPGGAEVRGDSQARDGIRRVAADDDRNRRRLGRRGDARRLEREQHPIEPEPEADARRRPAAEQLDEPVVAPAAADRGLLARRRPAGIDLERGPRVVVEPAHEPRLELVLDADGVRDAPGPPRSARRTRRTADR